MEEQNDGEMSTRKCIACDETVDSIDLLFVDETLYHKTCFKCSQCNGKLSTNNYSSLDGILYCKPHCEPKFKKNGRLPRKLSLRARELRKTPKRLSSILFRAPRKQAVSKKIVRSSKEIVAPETISEPEDNGGGASSTDAPTILELEDNGDATFTADAPLISEPEDNDGGASIDQILTTANGQFDLATIMNQVMQNPALSAGVSNQTGFDSPDFFRNMLDQLSQNPEMMNAISQLGHQIDGNQDLDTMFAAMSKFQGGSDNGVNGLDLSIMVQQMMPLFSQALSRRGSTPNLLEQVPSTKCRLHRRSYSDSASLMDLSMDCQLNLLEVVQKIEDEYPPLDVFSSVVETAALLHDNIHSTYGLAELCSDEDLAQEFMLMLKRDVSRRLEKR